MIGWRFDPLFKRAGIGGRLSVFYGLRIRDDDFGARSELAGLYHSYLRLSVTK